VTLIEPGAVILVTGATGSIGFEVAAQAAEQGAVVGVHGSREETVADAVARLRERAPQARLIAVAGDITQPGVIEALVAKAAEEGGRLDAVIHCAIAGRAGASAGSVTGPFATTDPDGYGAVVASVVGAVERLCHAAMPHLARQGGTFLAFAADSGKFAAPRQSVMAGVYGAIMSFVRSLALEAARDGVRVHCISPSFVAGTRIFDRFVEAGGRADAASKRAGLGLPTPKDIAPMALFLCGPGAARITGQVISINGGLNA
jgi:3-oxoacyl-[acyl-carrier protein] reductase